MQCRKLVNDMTKKERKAIEKVRATFRKIEKLARLAEKLGVDFDDLRQLILKGSKSSLWV